MLDALHTRIRDAREKAGLTPEEMARRIGVGRTTYINFETGKTNLFSKNLRKTASVLGIPEDELLFGPRPDPEILDELTNWDIRKQQFIESYENSLQALREELEAAHRLIAEKNRDLDSLRNINEFLMKELSKQR